MITVNKKINGIFTKVEITEDMEEFKILDNKDKIEILENKYGIIDKIKQKEEKDEEGKIIQEEILKTENEILQEIFEIKQKQEKLENLKKEFDEKMEIFLSQYTRAERDTFDIQYNEAVYAKGKSKPSIKETYLIRKLAEKRGIDYKDYGTLVLNKRIEFLDYFAEQKAEYDEKINLLNN